MAKWEEDFKKLQAEAAAAGPLPAMLPEQQERMKACDAEINAVCKKYRCVAVIMENILRVNGQPAGSRCQILWMAEEAVLVKPEVV